MEIIFQKIVEYIKGVRKVIAHKSSLNNFRNLFGSNRQVFTFVCICYACDVREIKNFTKIDIRSDSNIFLNKTFVYMSSY